MSASRNSRKKFNRVYLLNASVFRVVGLTNGRKTCQIHSSKGGMAYSYDKMLGVVKDCILDESGYKKDGRTWEQFVSDGHLVEKGSPLHENEAVGFVHEKMARGVERWHGYNNTGRIPFYFMEIAILEVTVDGVYKNGTSEPEELCEISNGEEVSEDDHGANQLFIDELAEHMSEDWRDGSSENAEHAEMMRILSEWNSDSETEK